MNIVDGDLLEATEPIICHQINCLCVRGHGLSAAIAERYPYANVYALRRQDGRRNRCVVEDEGIPGDIAISTPPDDGPVVVGLYGQYDYGRGAGTVRTTREQDNPALRLKWFASALVNLEEYMHMTFRTSVAFPYGIGCGLAGGNWQMYSAMLDEFAKRTGFTVNVYRQQPINVA